jgi:ABC-type antimicrobial peptide transport system permease subunit
LKAIDPVRWREVAYYEEGWFRGASVQEAFQSMTKDNFTIILDSGVASYLSLHINSSIAITFSSPQGDSEYSFRVVCFFGPEPINYGFSFYSSRYWSYIPAGSLNEINATTYATDQLLVKLSPSANATSTVQQIENMGNTTDTLSTSSQLASMYSNYLLTGSQNVQNIGIALAVVGASLEIAAIITITFIERRKELTVLSVRGMSSKQISMILMLETLSLVGFALILGVIVGFIIVLGTINSSLPGELVPHRLSFPLNTVILVVGMLSLVLISVIIPIAIAARRAPSDARRKGGW